MSVSRPSRGQIVLLELDPIRGHEQGGKRPALIISSNALNHSAAELITVVPITTKGRPLRSFLKVAPPEGGLSQTSYIICDQVRTVSTGRVIRIAGSVRPSTLREVEDRIRIVLEL